MNSNDNNRMFNRVLSIWTVYDRPQDYPDQFVARRFEVAPHSTQPEITDDIIIAKDLELVRQALELRGLTKAMPRMESDQPHIVECWL